MSELRVHELVGPRFINPAWFARVRHGQNAGVVEASAIEVNLQGETLSLRAPDGGLQAGQAVKVWLNASGFFVCAADEEIERVAIEAARAERAKQAALALALDASRADADAFHARLKLPCRWDVGIKDLLSGLSAASWGDGRGQATVQHVLLLEDLCAGRLKRRAGDFLCTSAAGSNGKRWSGQVEHRAVDGGGQRYKPQVTCKACLAAAARWIQE
jgi:hypothetical protein